MNESYEQPKIEDEKLSFLSSQQNLNLEICPNDELKTHQTQDIDKKECNNNMNDAPFESPNVVNV